MSLSAPKAALREWRTSPLTLDSVRAEWVVVGLITLGAFVLRLSQIRQGLFGDEVLAYTEIAHHSLGQVIRTVQSGFESSPPLFFVLAGCPPSWETRRS